MTLKHRRTIFVHMIRMLGLSQAEAAELFGVHKQTVAAWYQGRQRPSRKHIRTAAALWRAIENKAHLIVKNKTRWDDLHAETPMDKAAIALAQLRLGDKAWLKIKEEPKAASVDTDDRRDTTA